MFKKIFGILFFSFCLTSSVYASEVVEKTPTDEQKKIEQLVIQAEIEARNETYKEFENLYPTYLGYLEDTKQFKESVNKKLDKKIAKHGIKRESKNTVENDGPIYSIAAASSPSTDAIDLRAPVVYSSSQGYFVKSSVYWKKKTNGSWYWHDHEPCCGLGTLNVGGADGLGIYFSNSTNLDVSSTSFYTYDENGGSYNTNLYAYRSNSAGAYYKAQDTIQNSTFNPYNSYSWHSAHISVWPMFNGKVSTIARTHWTHTWSSAEISGVSVSNSGVSVDITNADKAWDGVSNGYANVGN